MPTLTAGELALMRSDVPNTLLAMRCTFERFTAGTPDPYGGVTGTWGDYLPDTACWWAEDADEEIVGTEINALVSRQRIVLPAGTNVRTSDRVKEVIGVDGTQVAGPLDIREVLIRVAETVLIVREIG